MAILYKMLDTKRDKNGVIQYYHLQNKYNKTYWVKKDVLKQAIRDKKVEVVNLTLTSDNRLVEKEYKPEEKPEAEKSLELQQLKYLTDKLNEHRNAYYNQNAPKISDYEYDNMFDTLVALEKKLGMHMPDSPTHTVGYPVNSKWPEVRHKHPMLSLDKTKSVDDLRAFIKKPCVLMHKLDGLTISLCYSGKNGNLISAETRGNGEVGEDVTPNAKYCNIPLTTKYRGTEDLVIDGEAIIDLPTFTRINAQITDENAKYKNARNLAAGSVRNFDPKVVSKRGIQFIAWKVISGFHHINSHIRRLQQIRNLGFKVVSYAYIGVTPLEINNLEQLIDKLKSEATSTGVPIDGLVIGYDDINYSESLGATGHHIRSQLAYKFYDEEKHTIIRDIEWSMGKTGVLTPVAVFDPVELDGTTVNRASVHNLGIVKSLKLGIGDKVSVYKANQIIPQIKDNFTQSGKLVLPEVCPICEGQVASSYTSSTLNLICTNPNCKGKLLGKLTHFVGRDAMDIEGLSVSTLQKFVELGWLTKLSDIYILDRHKDQMLTLDKFGEKSVNNILESIEKSKKVSLAKFITALSIPNIGRRAGKQIAEAVKYDVQTLMQNLRSGASFAYLDDFGDIMDSSIREWATTENMAELELMASYLKFDTPTAATNSKVSGKTFVITGSLNNYPNRDALKDKLESMGARVGSSITSKTDYLINNDVTSTSTKNKKAKELGVPIISEAQLEQML